MTPRAPGAGARRWIDRLGLRRHPEGGYFRESYRSPVGVPASALPPGYDGGRAAATAIDYLLEAGDFSALHRLRSAELWFFLAGDPLLVHRLLPGDGPGAATRHEAIRLGSGAAGTTPTGLVAAGSWFGAELVPGGEYTLVGCVVVPGFEFADFEMGERQELLAQFPEHADLVRRLTRG